MIFQVSNEIKVMNQSSLKSTSGVDFPPANRSQMFFKIGVLKTFAKSQGNTCIGVSFE